jgi:8-oxo-dGTP pyrophosphatase MutT (NUDIX family)
VGSPDETVGLVDERGAVVGQVARAVMRRDNLRHAATAVLVRRPDGGIYVHQRSPDKDWCPGCHDAVAGGVLQSGEQPEASARRELAEELGISGVPLRRLGTSLYEDDTVRVFEHCFEVTYDGPVTHADGEVTWGAWMSLPELGDRLRDRTWPFVPDTRALLTRLCTDGVGDYDRLAPEGPDRDAGGGGER